MSKRNDCTAAGPVASGRGSDHLWTRAVEHEAPVWMTSPRLRRFTELWVEERRRQLFAEAGP